MKTIVILTCLPGYSGRLIYASKTAVRFIPAYTGNQLKHGIKLAFPDLFRPGKHAQILMQFGSYRVNSGKFSYCRFC